MDKIVVIVLIIMIVLIMNTQIEYLKDQLRKKEKSENIFNEITFDPLDQDPLFICYTINNSNKKDFGEPISTGEPN